MHCTRDRLNQDCCDHRPFRRRQQHHANREEAGKIRKTQNRRAQIRHRVIRHREHDHGRHEHNGIPIQRITQPRELADDRRHQHKHPATGQADADEVAVPITDVV